MYKHIRYETGSTSRTLLQRRQCISAVWEGYCSWFI